MAVALGDDGEEKFPRPDEPGIDGEAPADGGLVALDEKAGRQGGDPVQAEGGHSHLPPIEARISAATSTSLKGRADEPMI